MDSPADPTVSLAESTRIELHLTPDQLKGMLRTCGIIKNFHAEEAQYIMDQISRAPAPWGCLAFVNGVLLDNLHIEKRSQENLKRPRRLLQPNRRISYTFIYLPFTFTALRQLDQFRSFRRLLFYTRIHFESSFECGRWAADDRGLYARSSTLKADLSALSNVHNKVFDALAQFKAGRPERGQALMRNTLVLHGSIVQNHHHRQFSDVLGILLLIQRDGLTAIQGSITKSLVCLAAQVLPHNDPRRFMFESLVDLPLDSSGHLYLAFDAYCRHIWRERTGGNDAKACYSYNQASFPRADRGAFYEFFHKRELDDVQHILNEMDGELGQYSHEAFILWHTALRCLHGEQRYRDMEALARRLCWRVYLLGRQFDYHEQPQLNLDSALSFYLLGNALEAQEKQDSAKMAYANCLELRNEILPLAKWDGAKAASLRKIEAIATRLENLSIADGYRAMGQEMYSLVEMGCVDRGD